MRFVIETHIPFAITQEGMYVVDELWGLDLQAYVNHIKNVVVLAPICKLESVILPYYFSKESIRFLPIAKSEKEFNNFTKLPLIAYRLYRYLEKGDIMCSSEPVFPPLGLISNLICWARRNETRIMVFDSDFDRDREIRLHSLEDGHFHKNLISFLYGVFYTGFMRFCIYTTPVTFVVGDALYEKYKNYGNVIKIYASWVKRESIISPEDLRIKAINLYQTRELKICFAARFISKKQPQKAVEIIKLLRDRNVRVILDVYGEGSLQDELISQVKSFQLEDRITFKGSVSYDSFCRILRQYDIIIVPNLSNEQPRVLFDAFANGVAVICSDTEAFNRIIVNEKNGILCTPNNLDCFAEAIIRLHNNRDLLDKIIREGVDTARENTIESRHEKMVEIIIKDLRLNLKSMTI